MNAKAQRWGTSVAIRIPKPYAVDLRVDARSVIDLDLVEAKLVVTPDAVVPSLDALLAQVTPENVHAETDVGPAVGREAWRRPTSTCRIAATSFGRRPNRMPARRKAGGVRRWCRPRPRTRARWAWRRAAP